MCNKYNTFEGQFKKYREPWRQLFLVICDSLGIDRLISWINSKLSNDIECEEIKDFKPIRDIAIMYSKAMRDNREINKAKDRLGKSIENQKASKINKSVVGL